MHSPFGLKSGVSRWHQLMGGGGGMSIASILAGTVSSFPNVQNIDGVFRDHLASLPAEYGLKVGFITDMKDGEPVLGPELVTNPGGPYTETTGYTITLGGGTVAVVGGNLEFSPASTGRLVTTLSGLTVGGVYRFVISQVGATALRITTESNGSGGLDVASGQLFSASANTLYVAIIETGGQTTTISSVSVRQYPSELIPATQANDALRPLYGRAPVDAPSGGAIDQGSGPEYLRFDLTDDKLTHTFPDGFTGDVMLFGRNGSWIENNITIPAGGVLDIGPSTITGGTPGMLRALGDVVGWLPVGKVLSEAEKAYLVAYYRERGAKGLLMPGPELVTNGGPFVDTASWTPVNAALSVVGSNLRITGTGGTFARASATVNGLVVGQAYELSITLASASVSGVNGTAFWFSSGVSSSAITPISGVNTTITIIATATATSAVANLYATRNAEGLNEFSEWSSVSVRQLTPQEAP